MIPRWPKSGHVSPLSPLPEKSASSADFIFVSKTWPLGSKFLNLLRLRTT